jgi:hypothetical protein
MKTFSGEYAENLIGSKKGAAGRTDEGIIKGGFLLTSPIYMLETGGKLVRNWWETAHWLEVRLKNYQYLDMTNITLVSLHSDDEMQVNILLLLKSCKKSYSLRIQYIARVISV